MRVQDPEELSTELMKVKLTAKALDQENNDLQKEVHRVQTTIVALEPLEVQLKAEKILQDENNIFQIQLKDLHRHREEEAAILPYFSPKSSLWRRRTPL